MIKKVSLASAIASIMAFGQAFAGEIRVVVSSHAPTTNEINVTLSGNSVDLRKSTADSWRFSFYDPVALDDRIVIKIDNLPQGYRTGTWAFDIPYYWEGRSRRQLAVALSNDASIDAMGQSFVEWARNVSMRTATVSQLALMNQRARIHFSDRYTRVMQRSRLPERLDVNVTYWFLLSSRGLMEQAGFVLDDVVYQAANWLLGLANDPAQPEMLFRDVSRAQVHDLVEALRGREKLLSDRIVQRISRQLRSPHAADKDAACEKARSLKDRFDDLYPRELEQLDPTRRLSATTTINVVLCAAAELRRYARTGAEVEVDLVGARMLHEQLIELMQYLEETQQHPALRRQAGLRASEFLAFIDAIENAGPGATTPFG